MFRRILLPLDLDDPSSWSKALPVALDLASKHGSQVTLGTVISDWEAARDVQWSSLGYRRMIKDAELRLRRLADEHGLLEFDIKVAVGAVGSTIVDLAKRVEAELIVLASHRPGPKDYLIGAHALHVVRHASCSVFVVRS
jgi:nucleotide-binding universal stress UspA family protein